jgi:hypothetical protein
MTTLAHPVRRMRGLRGFLALVVVVAGALAAGAGTADAGNRVTLNTGWKNTSGTDLYRVAANFAGIASKASAVCGASSTPGDAATSYLMYLRNVAIVPSLVYGTFTALAWKGMLAITGMDPCSVAKQTATAAWDAGWNWSKGNAVYIWMYIWQEDRSFQPDRCHAHTWMWLGGKSVHVINDLVYVVLPGSGGCPR